MGILKTLKEGLQNYSQEEQKRIWSAAEWAIYLHRGQRRRSGEWFSTHPLTIATTLIKMQMDPDSIIAGLLHDTVEDTENTTEEIAKRYGETPANLVEGVTKITLLKSNKNIQEAETIRKMLISMCDDIRVMIIKLADKLHNMQTLSSLKPERQKEIAHECLEIYAPLADRLGMSWMKVELEDLCLKTLRPDMYQYIRNFIMQSKSERNNMLDTVKDQIIKATEKEGLSNIEVMARAKHFYSIYNTMKKRKKDVDELFDLQGVRIICRTTAQCYMLLGIVHTIFKPVEDRFKDYIGWPKDNNYQSIHTTVMAEGKLLEIQIRTRAMHYTAEYGIAAHWAYKAQVDPQASQNLSIITKLKNWTTLQGEGNSFLEEIKQDILKDSIYIFTPKGDIIELPKGATALDFAYHIHTEVGNRTVGASVNGAIVPLSKPLKTKQVVEIRTSKNGKPHLQWLRIVTTTRARSKIRQWLNKHDENLFIDNHIVVSNKKPQESTDEKEQQEEFETREIVKDVFDDKKIAFSIGKEKNLMISIAACCHPKTGDDIMGYVSRGRGVIVHKTSCPNLKNIKEISDRTVSVAWEEMSPKTTQKFRVISKITPDLFAEIEGAVRKYKGHLISGHLEENEKDQLEGTFIMEMEDQSIMSKLVKGIRLIPSVLDIRQLS